MPELTSSDAAARIAEIDQELAVLTSGSGARAAVDATRQDLTFWKDFLGTTAKELGEAKDEIESTIEELGGRSLPTPGQPSVDDLADAVRGLGGGDSANGQAIESGIETNFSFDVAGGGPPFDMGLVVYDLLNQQSV